MKKTKIKFSYILKILACAGLMLLLFFYLPLAVRKVLSVYRTKELLQEMKKETGGMRVTREDVVRCLRLIDDPEFHRNIYDLGLVKSVMISEEKNIEVVLQTIPNCPYKMELYLVVKQMLENIPDVGHVRVKLEAATSWDYLKLDTK